MFGVLRSVRLPGSAACVVVVRQRLEWRKRLADVTSTAGSRRPEREVVCEGGPRSHVHEVVAQQAAASTQRLVDLRDEDVARVDGEPQCGQHVALLHLAHLSVVVAADPEYVPVYSELCKISYMM